MSQYKFGVVFDAKTGQFISNIKGAERSIESFDRSIKVASVSNKQFAKSLNTTNISLKNTERQAHGAHGSITDMVKSMAIMSAVMGTVGLSAKLVTDLATFQDLRLRLQGMSDDAVDYAEKEGYLIDLAKRHHKELTGLADGYAGLSVMVKEYIINDDQARKMLEGLSNAASATGADASNLKQVFYGLNQTLGQGVVQAQELNQVVEPMPGLLSKLARAAGQETGSAFRKLVSEGKVTSEMFATYMVKALKEYDGAAAKTANNINAKFTDISNAYLLLSKNLETPINNALLPVLNSLTTGLTAFSENTDTVVKAISVALNVAIIRGIAALTNYSAATIASTLTKQRAANQTVSQAQAELKLALAYKASAFGAVQNTIADKRLTSARNALAVATKRASLAQRGLSAGLSLLGGPVGVAMLAAYAIYEFASGADEAAEKAIKLKNATADLNPFKNYTFEQATGALQRYKGQLDLAKQAAENAQKRFKNDFLKGTAGEVDKANKKVEELSAKILALQNILNEKTTKTDKPKSNTKTLDIFAQQQAALTKQLALLGKTTELAKAEYATTYGKYKDLLPAQKQEILALAKSIDLKNKALAADVAANNQAAQLAKSAQNYAASLQRKIALTGEVSNVAQLNYEIEHGSLQGINDELRTHLQLLAEKADKTQALADQQLPFWEQMKEHIGSTSEDFNAMWGNTFDRFAQGIGDATSTAIIEGQSFGNTMKTIAKAAIKEVISGLVQLGVKKLALFAIEKTINKAAAASGGGVMLAEAQASSLIAGINAFKSTAAIPVVGPAMAPGAMTAALAITTPMVAGVAGMVGAMAGMAHDGIDEIPKEGTWLLDKGERVVDSRTNQDLKQALNKGEVGGGNISVSVTNVFEAGSDEDNFSEDFFDQQREAIYNAVAQAKADRGEDF